MKWMKDNGLKLVTGIGFTALCLAAAWGVSKSQVGDLRSITIPAIQATDRELAAVDKEQSRAITAVEKDIIGVKASVEAVGVKQEAYHEQSDKKLDLILSAVERRNESP